MLNLRTLMYIFSFHMDYHFFSSLTKTLHMISASKCLSGKVCHGLHWLLQPISSEPPHFTSVAMSTP